MRICLLPFALLLTACYAADVGTAPKGSAASTTNSTSAHSPSVIKGVDLSKWQGNVDFARIKSNGESYVFIKATQGNWDVDPNYARNINSARAAGLAAGSYHFYVTDHKPETQFENFSKHVSLRPGDLPPVMDIEVLCKNSLPHTAAELKVFLQLVENKYGVKPILYSGKSFASEYLKAFADYPFWLAEYNSDKVPELPNGWKSWTFWQHTQAGKVAGVDGAVDLDRFNGTQEAFQALLVPAVARYMP